jgi:TonB family protein
MRIGEPRISVDRTPSRQTSFNAMDPVLAERVLTDQIDSRRRLRLAIVVGLLVHAVLFMIVFPAARSEPRYVGREQHLYAIRQIRFSPPPAARRAAKPQTNPKAKKIPIPDPTPDEPEPVVDETSQTSDLDFPGVSSGEAVAVPEGPSGPGVSVYQVSGNVKAPEKIHAPEPIYPEEARLAHIQGVVILQTIIDAKGDVTDIRVLKGLPSGLTEAAVAAVSQWRFRPATLEGVPVAVHYLVTISFSVQ